MEPFGDDEVEMTATLLSTSVEWEELEEIAAKLVAQPFISQAYWNPSTSGEPVGRWDHALGRLPVRGVLMAVVFRVGSLATCSSGCMVQCAAKYPHH